MDCIDGAMTQFREGLEWVVLARLVAAYISDWCRTETGHFRTFSTMQNGAQKTTALTPFIPGFSIWMIVS
jgi:hypothetical protein